MSLMGGGAFLQVLSCASEAAECGSAASFLLFSDNKRYLINCGEGTQRFCVEHGVKLARTSHVLLASTAWTHIGGLVGLALTLADSGLTRLDVVAPRGLLRSLRAARSFLYRPATELTLVQFADSDPMPTLVHDDEHFTVRAVLLRTAAAAAAVGAVGAAAGVPACRHHSMLEPTHLEAIQCACLTAPRGTDAAPRAVAFAIHVAAQAGKFDAQRADALGVPAGPLRGALVRGETVRSATTGAAVRPHDCIGLPTPGRVAVLCFASTVAELDALAANDAFAAAYLAPPNALVAVVVHTAPAAVFNAPAYVAWRARFAPTTAHRWAHVDADALCRIPPLVASSLLQRTLHGVAPEIFRPYQGDDEPVPPTTSALAAPPMFRFALAPLKRVGAVVDSLTHLHDKRAAKRLAEATRLAALPTPSVAAAAPTLAASAAPFPALTFLGTGSAIPSKCRNVTCILLRVSAERSVFLDCGEGSLGQLRRALDAPSVDAVLRSLSCVWLSHRHPDHHLGLESLLLARRALLGADAAPLLVVAPLLMREWLSELVEPIDFVACSDIAALDDNDDDDDAALDSTTRQRVAAQCGVERFSTVPVQHILDSHGVVLRHAQWSLAFSGDTTPCAAFARAAADVDVLIHEATLEDGMELDALAKNHTTTSQALLVAQQARARFLVLTHFSQRYPKIPTLPVQLDGTSNVVISFDLMTVRFDQLRELPQLTPILQLLLDEADNDGDDGDGDGDDADDDNAVKKAKR